MRALGLSLLGAAACLFGTVAPAFAQQLTLRETWEGPIGYVSGATTTRTADNTNPCNVVTNNNTNTSVTISGIPAGAVIKNAFLYWAGSYLPGTTARDNTVTFDGNSYTASGTLNVRTAAFVNGQTTYDYFGNRVDVTSRFTDGTPNGTYQLSRLVVHNGNPHCATSAVVGGWALYVIYEHPSLPIRRVQMLDGLRAIHQATEAVQLAGSNRLEIAPSHVSTFTYLLYDGDPDLSTAENIVYNNTILSSAQNPVNNPFNSSTAFGVDLDTWNATDYTQPGASSADLDISVGNDMVLLQAVITSLDTKGVVVTPDGSAVIPRLQNGRYSQVFVAENTSIIAGIFDLIAGTTGVMTIDSIRGPGVTTQTRADSARVNLSAGVPTNYTVWYRVPVGAPITVQVGVAARWTAYPTQSGAADTGYVNVRRVQPQLSLAKSVSPTGVLATGTDLTYTIAATNVGEWAATGVVVADTVPKQVQFKLGSTGATLPAGLTATVTYLDANGSVITPTSGAGAVAPEVVPAGYDARVRVVRWTVSGALPSGGAVGSFNFVARIK